MRSLSAVLLRRAPLLRAPSLARCWSSGGEAQPERESMPFDVCIVGAGPAGLAAAIRLKQLCAEKEVDYSVCVIDKGAEVGAHTLSGNVFEPRALDELLPGWREDETCPIKQKVTGDRFYWLTSRRAFRLPAPPQMHNKGNYVISLSETVRWLGAKAEDMGVEVYAGFAGASLLRDSRGRATGVRTNDVGVSKAGRRKEGSYAPGMDLLARATLLAEGCRGSLSQQAMRDFDLRGSACPQTYALGIKEVWEIAAEKHRPGLTVHTVGHPLDQWTYGGSFLYHMDQQRVALGLVVALDYSDPYLSPFQEFQQLKRHPYFARLLDGGTCLQYGARTLNEGGLQSLPERLAFPGGALLGDAAGTLNVPKIKGTHTALKSGALAAQAAFDALQADPAGQAPLDLSSYDESLRASWVCEELSLARNIRPGFQLGAGLLGGLAHGALDTYLLRGKAPWTLKHAKADHECLKPAHECTKREYPPPDGKLTFDINTSLFRSGTNHEHDQPAHLRLRNPRIPTALNKRVYDGPEARYCPAGVYEYVPRARESDSTSEETQELVINAQNCLHCKACDIKDPSQNINWTVPEGGGGPAYNVM
ncbi:electron transfer flavoprotein-ubiquinone oxidoreductase [Helicosporidium sp. ATCC 50920]|nr:electron transfer flavoprotein-ubiquinone oxidoreductase [Helicosporidium sp. ATCC 50920]|eukprot:KDD76408.1 electron transfer flavoprotein-ubiquinone oxidoreductase [Helicosporidium sp. ATCC 50920]